MKRKITKIKLSLTLNRKLYDIIDGLYYNKSNYIQNLIYQDLLKNTDDQDLKKMIL